MRVRGSPIAVLAALIAISSPLMAQPSGKTMAQPSGKTAQPATLSAAARSAAATVDDFHAALRRGDTRAAAALLADNALIFEAGGVERTKAEYAAHHLSADAAYSQAVHSVVTRRAGQSNDMLAWIASEGRTTGTYKGRSVNQITAETMVLRRIGRAWKIVHIHWSSAAKR